LALCGIVRLIGNYSYAITVRVHLTLAHGAMVAIAKDAVDPAAKAARRGNRRV
jgi:hypothetical protein